MRPIVVALIALMCLASSAAANQCGQHFKSFWGKLEQKNYQGISPEQLAGMSRMVLRAYDACQAGDRREADALFERLALLHDGPDKSTGPFNPNMPSQ
jgi:hypothetical protein